ncbi:MAG: phosphoribosylformylglycinamidine synthase subunit PurS [ANME-2 cluster archaeon]|nr:phosphoribosylformylglycinamidine synthase subunit PurS [ANME-2 cluster archaeon]MBC2700164.1 phosphoribosylformylglycinamidine synthase subunit PurS [ANME-2 cluster archaeon]MBC2706698.1 phosphoribosylformylglycinamidine synthase subunit PurS [ANME-2 cluster archaeon]MBC2745628.1 phosphoribosylformylglycinamidine synthase subunit PurS [ANME-2 cluster archaeon]MBC2762816.1 phosphoribosylformylglycinamidine synthase subunit PurS [ANME-2 cluster archaeon]
MKYHAEVTIGLKSGMLDPEATTIQKALEHLGFPTDSLEMQKCFVLELDAPSRDEAKSRVDEMCRRLLANPVIHNYDIEIEESG